MGLRIINGQQVRHLLTMPLCIDAMALAMMAASAGKIKTPPRLIFPLIDDSALFALMPGSSLDPACYGAKIVSLHAQNPAQGRPPIQGFVTLFDHETGAPFALIEGGEVTAIRTAAASGLAARELARADARTHGVLGTGVQARTHVAAIAAVRDIEQVVIWGRDPKKAEALVAELAPAYDCEITAGSLEQAAACAIVSAVTGASEPVLLKDQIAAGTHINLVGAHSPKTREAEGALVGAAKVYVDSYESAGNEAGDLLIAEQEGHFSLSAIVGEIGEVVAGAKPARTSDDDITLYKSLGVVGQDLFAAELVYRQAIAQGIGVDVTL